TGGWCGGGGWRKRRSPPRRARFVLRRRGGRGRRRPATSCRRSPGDRRSARAPRYSRTHFSSQSSGFFSQGADGTYCSAYSCAFLRTSFSSIVRIVLPSISTLPLQITVSHERPVPL